MSNISKGKHNNAHVDDANQSYYATRTKIYPREVSGRYQRLRNLAVFVLLGLYYLVPWVQWAERQGVLFDLPARKFYIFSLVLWPQDFFYLAGLLIVAAFALFLFTAVAGRIWCGYACPQTVWTEAFIWMERWIEGSHAQQMKLDDSSFSTHKFTRKVLKHGLWITFALWTGFTFVGYFTPIRELGVKILEFNTGPWETFWILFYGFATYGNAGWLREQVCIYMCPYARFQSAMFDKHTLIVSYDSMRGEPRGSRRRGSDPADQGLGDCVNCTLCVQVCPTGIDIREGLQYQCISCAACVDVCNAVMEKVDSPQGLIRYTSEAALETPDKTSEWQWLRPRVVVYSVMLIGIMGAIVAGVVQRNMLELDVIRDRNALYRQVGSTHIENVYTIKIMNKDSIDHELTLMASGIDGLLLKLDNSAMRIEAGSVVDVPVRIQVPTSALALTSTLVEFTIQSLTDSAISNVEAARFLGPVQ